LYNADSRHVILRLRDISEKIKHDVRFCLHCIGKDCIGMQEQALQRTVSAFSVPAPK
jgi:hypothetical protein